MLMHCFSRRIVSRRSLLSAAGAVTFTRFLDALPLQDIKLGITTDEISDDPTTAAEFLSRYHLQVIFRPVAIQGKRHRDTALGSRDGRILVLCCLLQPAQQSEVVLHVLKCI